MDSKTNIPSFTVSLRGYDRVEVDEYLDSLADALGQVEDAQEQNRRMQDHIGRLNGRIKDLEERINSDTPKTGAIIGERIGIMLRTAEEAAADTVQRAEARAAELRIEAEQRVAEAEESARVSVAGGQEQARRIEAAARAEAAEIISEAEARATARTHQIEQWAEQVVSHTRAEEARMLREQQEKRNAALAELAALRDQRDAVASTLAELRETLGQALGLVVPPVQPTPPSKVTVSAGDDTASAATLSATTGIRDEEGGVEPYAEDPAAGLLIGSAASAATSGTGTDRTGANGTGANGTGANGTSRTGAGANGRGSNGTGVYGTGAHGVTVLPPPALPEEHEEHAGQAAQAEDEIEHAGEAGHSDDADAEAAAGSVGAVPAEQAAGAASGSGSDTDLDDTVAWPVNGSGRPPFDGEAVSAEAQEPVTSEIEVQQLSAGSPGDQDADEFEAKLEAWVSDGAKSEGDKAQGAKHFRRM